jgi:hypothetical protein
MFVKLPHKRVMQSNGRKMLKIKEQSSSEEEGSSGS